MNATRRLSTHAVLCHSRRDARLCSISCVVVVGLPATPAPFTTPYPHPSACLRWRAAHPHPQSLAVDLAHLTSPCRAAPPSKPLPALTTSNSHGPYPRHVCPPQRVRSPIRTTSLPMYVSRPARRFPPANASATARWGCPLVSRKLLAYPSWCSGRCAGPLDAR